MSEPAVSDIQAPGASATLEAPVGSEARVGSLGADGEPAAGTTTLQ